MLIECISCRECFKPSEIKYKSGEIEDRPTYEEMQDHADTTGAEFDCPKCGERQYLSDCEFF